MDILCNNLSDIASSSTLLTTEEERGILETKDSNLCWKLSKLQERKNAHCVTCKAAMPAGKMFVEVNGWYIPPNKNFAVERNFYFCASFLCLKRVPSSNIVPPNQDTFFEVIKDTDFSPEDRALLKFRGFKFVD